MKRYYQHHLWGKNMDISVMFGANKNVCRLFLLKALYRQGCSHNVVETELCMCDKFSKETLYSKYFIPEYLGPLTLAVITELSRLL